MMNNEKEKPSSNFVHDTNVTPMTTTTTTTTNSSNFFASVNSNGRKCGSRAGAGTEADKDDTLPKIGVNGPGAFTCRKTEFARHFKDPGYDRSFNSLPLFVYMNELPDDIDSIQINSGMDCMPLANSTHHPTEPGGAYHNYNLYPLHQSHLIQSDQAKSLQELQNEVGALLEFRDLVIETFPDLKHKMASMSASGSTTNTLTGIASNSSLASRREWEPGIRIKRKIIQKDPAVTSSQTVVAMPAASTSATGAAELASSLSRSRSNSHSGKKEPKSGEGNGSVVQDSGFSTETSSSKEAHSASSTNGALQGAVCSTRLPVVEADDELLNLLDVIHRKSNRLRDEVEHLQSYERDKRDSSNSTTKSNNINNSSSSNSLTQRTFEEHVDRLKKEDIQQLRKERDRLLDKLAEMEAETLTGRIKATKMHDQMEQLVTMKKELEEQLKLALSQKLELDAKLLELNKNSSKSSSSQSDTSSQRNFLSSASTVLSTATSLAAVPPSAGQSRKSTVNTFQPVVIDTGDNSGVHGRNVYSFQSNSQQLSNISSDNKPVRNVDYKNLGRLDNLVSAPNRLSKVRVTDSKKIAAILLETNVIELQRHLLTLTVQNQVLMQKLDQATKSKMFLVKRLEKSKEDVEDLRFQLEERNIELEGTKAQLRVIEAKMDYTSNTSNQETNRSSSTLLLCHEPPVMHPSMKAMIPLAMDEIQQHSSSTESAHDQAERDTRQTSTTNSECMNGFETPKRTRPSKIPLPGSKGYLAPRPPSGKGAHSAYANKSLSRSTGSLCGGKSLSSLNRPDSVQSNRKESSSIGTSNSRSSSSSIPVVASKTTTTTTPSPHKNLTNSPLPKLKRDTLTSRVRHLDSLSRVYNNNSNNISNCNISPSSSSNSQNSSSTSSPSNNNGLSTSTPNQHSHSTSFRGFNSTKKDLSSNFNQGQQFTRKQSSTAPLSTTSNVNISRRFSSASIGRGTTATSATTSTSSDLHNTDPDSGKVRNFRSTLFGWLKM